MLQRGSDRPWHFTEVELGAAGVRVFREGSDRPPDCVLLDYHLPDMDAPKVLVELRNGSEFPTCPVVILTGSGVHGDNSVLHAGAQECIDKRWLTPESLTRAIENAIERFNLMVDGTSAERKPRESEAKAKARADELSTILEAVPAIIFLAHDRWCRSMSCSQATRRFLRLPEGASSSMSVPDGEKPSHFRLFQDGRELAPEELPVQMAAATGREVRDFALTVEFNDGTARDISGGAVPLFDEFGNVRGAVGSFIDISDRKEAEAALQEIAERYERQSRVFDTTLSAITDFAYIFDREGRFLYANKALLNLWGLTLEAAVGKNFFDLQYPDDLAAKLQRQIQQVFRNGEGLSDETPYTSPTGVAGHYEYIFSPVIAADGTVEAVAGSTRVITERKRAEAALIEARQAAEAANQTKDRFLAVLSHELRSPLTPMLMAVAALEHDSDLRPAVREHLAMIKRNIQLETKLIDDLLDLSRITSGKVELDIEAIDLREAVRHVCVSCRSQMSEKGICLQIELDDTPALIAADSARIQQVLLNLLINAIKFTPENGTIRVTTARQESSRWEVRVEDSGIGISVEALPRIFDAFEQGGVKVTRQFGGLGLGLAISKSLVELHRGSIRAESAGLGRGSTFIVELPGEEADTVDKAPLFAPAEDGEQPKMRLLLVEDHQDTARTISRLLRSAGFAVTAVSDVAGASVAAHAEPFDVLVSDLGLPDGDGYELMRRIRAIRSMPGIAMSGYGMNEDRRRSHEAGFSEHLVKPIDVSQLIAAIRRVTDNRG
jgi:PAS domain S-box-containing protein